MRGAVEETARPAPDEVKEGLIEDPTMIAASLVSAADDGLYLSRQQ